MQYFKCKLFFASPKLQKSVEHIQMPNVNVRRRVEIKGRRLNSTSGTARSRQERRAVGGEKWMNLELNRNRKFKSHCKPRNSKKSWKSILGVG